MNFGKVSLPGTTGATMIMNEHHATDLASETRPAIHASMQQPGGYIPGWCTVFCPLALTIYISSSHTLWPTTFQTLIKLFSFRPKRICECMFVFE